MAYRPLTDDQLMPFGKHKGISMKEVPASYYHLLWNSFTKNDRDGSVGHYIQKSLPVLKKNNPDLIWK